MAEQAPVIEKKDPTAGVLTALQEKFGDAVRVDDREGYSGIIVAGDKLVEVATALRDDLGYNYLASASAVDYLGKGDHLEMVYHLANVDAVGNNLVVKAQTPRDVATLPSVVPVWPGADFQEREAYDLMGITFEGHPYLKRILMWEGFAGHPLRKDWHEAYYEQDQKPFDSRWPEGDVWRSEQKNVYGKNVKYPDGFTLDDYEAQAERVIYEGMDLGVDVRNGIAADTVIVSMGPQHPSTHGVFRMVVTLDGETIVKLRPVMGYLHRNHEKIGERNTWIGNMPFTDRLDYFCSLHNNFGYALAVEQLLAMGKRYEAPTYRAEVIRVLMAELTRILNHLVAIGFLLNDLGAYFTPLMYAIVERELILDFFEAVTGSRMMCNYFRFGGVAYDLPERMITTALAEDVNQRVRDMDTMQYLRQLITERLPKAVEQTDKLLTQNEIITNRAIDVGVLTREDAIAYSAAGPVLRASGVAYDLRRSDPYSIYPDLNFDVAVRKHGDIYDRFLIRLDEMRESLKILKQILPLLAETAGQPFFAGRATHTVKTPVGESYGHSENPKGELGYYVVSDGGGNPWRYHVRAPSFINLTALDKMCQGHKVADVVGILGSIDIVLGELDR
ncbi:MAG: NADH-quinone oxidoreductase subunit D [Anaerolineae bacterium]|nr:NADH-quinone oxidoreductase subunit D [Anaerolineae bacterium]